MAMLEIGQIIKGRYRVDAYLGGGGMADVYKVFDTTRRVDLAMKVLKQDLAEDREFLRRFRGEAKRYAKLQHPHIVRYYGLEQDERIAFMLLDYIDGRTLKTEIFNDNAPLIYEKIWLIMLDICNALNYAHDSRYVHCDVKPANIMINRQGVAYLTDFGIAREVDATTSTMVGFGAPAYMAPEQVKGQDPTPRTDIYSLGVTLYEMLTGGRRPFTGELAKTTGTASARVRWEQLKLKPPSPRTYNPAISEKLEALVMRCLQKDSRRRYRSAMALLKDLQDGLPELDPKKLENRRCLWWEDGRKKVSDQQNIFTGFMNWLSSIAARIPTPFIQKNPIVLLAAFLVVLAGIFAAIFWPNKPSDKVPDAITTQIAKENGESSNDGGSSQPVPAPQDKDNSPSSTSTPKLSKTPPECTRTGLTWTDPTDMAQLVCVPAGDFIMGSTESNLFAKTRRGELLYRDIYLEAYWVDETEVSVAQFEQFVNETGYVTDAENGQPAYTMIVHENEWIVNPQADWQHPRGTGEQAQANHPVTQVSWNDAMTFCDWAERSLPTEAQWEKAVRGTDGFSFPFEKSDDYVLCVNANISDNALGAPNSKECDDGFKYTAPVHQEHYCDSYLGECESVLISPYRTYNMLGNVSEWVLDDWNEKHYRSIPSSNPFFENGSDRKCLRGGSWASITDKVRPTNRDSDLKYRSFDTVGFRCVYNP